MAEQHEAALISGQGLKLEDGGDLAHAVEACLREMDANLAACVEQKWLRTAKNREHATRLGYDTTAAFLAQLARAYDVLDGYLVHDERRRRETRENLRSLYKPATFSG